MYPYLALSVSPYPNSALSAGQLAIIAVVPVLSLAAWLIAVFAANRGAAARPERHRCRSSRVHRNKSVNKRSARSPDVLLVAPRGERGGQQVHRFSFGTLART